MHTKKIECGKCGSLYELSFTRLITRDSDSISCEVCGEELYRWDEAKAWSQKLIQRHENHLKKKE